MKLGVYILSALMAMTVGNVNLNVYNKTETKKAVTLKEDGLFIEYGHAITNTDLYAMLDYSTRPKNVGLSVSTDLEQDKDYYSVGLYDATLNVDDKTYNVYLEVDDTTKPRLNAKTVEVEKGYSGDLKELVSIEELSAYTVSIDLSKVDFNTVGKYKAGIKIIDDYFNTTKDTLIVSVKEATVENTQQDQSQSSSGVDVGSVPAYSGTAYVAINNNVPGFTDYEVQEATVSYQYYSPLDNLGRCQVATASIGQDIMPTSKRSSISSVTPTGWKNKKYSNVSGGWLYNRCHLIGYQLTGQNANKQNLITGTRYLNIDGMLSFENQVAQYVKNTGDHVLYRVTPIYEGNNLLASGVQMEACSVADHCQSVGFNIYAYNVQPGVNIDYSTGESWN